MFLNRRPFPTVIAHLAMPCFLFLLSPAAFADQGDSPSPSNYGGVGLLDMHTARFLPDGYLALTTSFTKPDDRYALTFQALPWAEFTFRYAITHGLFDTGVPLNDRSFDLKVRLSRETEYLPQLAMGFQDILGTGVYSAEYFVGSKRFGPLDFTLGVGWGRLGSRGAFENPLGLLSKSFLTRTVNVGSGGVPLLKSYFHGPDVGLFAGVEYDTPIENLRLKIEYSSDAYVDEKRQSGNDFSFPLNVGFNYSPFSWLNIGLSLMHGHYAGLQINALIDSSAENWQSRLNPPPRFRSRAEDEARTILQSGEAAAASTVPAIVTRNIDLGARQPNAEPAENVAPERQTSQSPEIVSSSNGTTSNARQVPPTATVTALDPGPIAQIRQGLDSQDLVLVGTAIKQSKLVTLIENNRYRRDTEAISRTARVLSATAPPNIEDFEITLLRVGVPLTTVTLPRSQIDNLAERDGSPAELFNASELSPGQSETLDHLQPGLFPQLGGVVYPVFRQSLFDPDNPVYVRFGVGATEGLRLTRSWFVEGSLLASLYDDFDQIRRDANSGLPHVRSDIAQYLKKGRVEIADLSTSYFFKLAPEIYGRARAGYLEEMFAGAGGELLYRPFGQRWAIGADLWFVQQRDYHVLFDLRHYRALTGHLTAYYQMPWHDVRLAVSAGQYLAGDKGVTFEFSRRFSTGVQIGAWFTLTNVSAKQFGEGSFDKGIRIIIPFEWVAPFATQSGYDLSLRPIQRDGGQRLNGDSILYQITEPSSYGALMQEWNSVFK